MAETIKKKKGGRGPCSHTDSTKPPPFYLSTFNHITHFVTRTSFEKLCDVKVICADIGIWVYLGHKIYQI